MYLPRLQKIDYLSTNKVPWDARSRRDKMPRLTSLILWSRVVLGGRDNAYVCGKHSRYLLPLMSLFWHLCSYQCIMVLSSCAHCWISRFPNPRLHFSTKGPYISQLHISHLMGLSMIPEDSILSLPLSSFTAVEEAFLQSILWVCIFVASTAEAE